MKLKWKKVFFWRATKQINHKPFYTLTNPCRMIIKYFIWYYFRTTEHDKLKFTCEKYYSDFSYVNDFYFHSKWYEWLITIQMYIFLSSAMWKIFFHAYGVLFLPNLYFVTILHVKYDTVWWWMSVSLIIWDNVT
jgi:hypothetical protein